MNMTANEDKLKEIEHNKLSQVQKDHIATWNAAIEAALNEAMSDSEIFEAIRRLKK